MIKSHIDRNREFTPSQLAEGAKLAALIETCAADLAKLEILLDKGGYAQDSGGIWFHNGAPIPSPGQAKSSGVTPFAADR